MRNENKSFVWPPWIAKAGGWEEWEKWARRQSARCRTRANKWAIRNGRDPASNPLRTEWHKKILEAIKQSDGRGKFSRLPLTLEKRHNTDPRYPSIEHLKGPLSTDVALEQRLFNDMKTICSEPEFREAIGHLAKVLSIQPGKLKDQWVPKRSFGKPEGPEEPPLPKANR